MACLKGDLSLKLVKSMWLYNIGRGGIDVPWKRHYNYIIKKKEGTNESNNIEIYIFNITAFNEYSQQQEYLTFKCVQNHNYNQSCKK